MNCCKKLVESRKYILNEQDDNKNGSHNFRKPLKCLISKKFYRNI